MIWQTFFIGFFLNNKSILKNKLNSILSSEPVPEPESKSIYTKQNYSSNNLETISYKSDIFNSKSGYDCRFENKNNSAIYNISRHFQILDILKILENRAISTNNKLDIIEQINNDASDISKYVPNINKNNLLNDW